MRRARRFESREAQGDWLFRHIPSSKEVEVTEDQVLIVLAGVGLIQVVMLFAQVKLFEINTTLKAIRELMQTSGNGQRQAEGD